MSNIQHSLHTTNVQYKVIVAGCPGACLTLLLKFLGSGAKCRNSLFKICLLNLNSNSVLFIALLNKVLFPFFFLLEGCKHITPVVKPETSMKTFKITFFP